MDSCALVIPYCSFLLLTHFSLLLFASQCPCLGIGYPQASISQRSPLLQHGAPVDHSHSAVSLLWYGVHLFKYASEVVSLSDHSSSCASFLNMSDMRHQRLPLRDSITPNFKELMREVRSQYPLKSSSAALF